MSERHPASGTDDGPSVHLFLYGTLLGQSAAAELLEGGRRVRPARVNGSLYDLGEYPALVLAGGGRVDGEIWRCAADLLDRIDAYEAVAQRLFRRVALRVDGLACWTYVAGPALAPMLEPGRRIPAGRWAAA